MAGLALPVCILASASADEIRLKDGRTIAGTVKQDKSDPKTLVVEVAPSTYITLGPSDIAHNGHRRTTNLREYAEKLKEVEATAESHCELAGWCTTKGLHAQAEAHYQRALDFDPDYKTARVQLKYRRDDTGRWTRVDDWMTKNRGKIRDGKTYIFPEVKAMNDAKRDFAEKTGAWRRTIKRLTDEMVKGSGKAQAELEQIDDPYAITALGEMLLNPKLPSQAKLVVLSVLEKFNTRDAIGLIANACMFDSDGIVSDACMNSLVKNGREYAIAYFGGFLRNSDPVKVNRAGTALRLLRADNMILPMIDALVTQHEVVVKDQASYNPGSFSTGGKARKEKVTDKNEEVLKALVALTSQNFGYDEVQWRAWYAVTFAAPVGDLRRDP